ncbi:hypothetical protein GLW05_03070 [Pontibacillus yanchengensis]|uniref:Uncharacterized protein n=1 Tax=Pontibacillus yanchengensis TaxID=462910 RepID=A0A6I5A2H5_9BACI|nr:hypothetical protein [Pontibacillus yanchengensis]MYL32571.1 hypothetical protein [Pontibacillus yanchengensis]
MANQGKILWTTVIFVLFLTLSLWYSSSYGGVAIKNEIKESVIERYNNQVTFDQIEYIDHGYRDTGEEWTVKYRVIEEGHCSSYRAWFSPDGSERTHLEPLNSCS